MVNNWFTRGVLADEDAQLNTRFCDAAKRHAGLWCRLSRLVQPASGFSDQVGEVAQEHRALDGAMDDDAAAVAPVDLAAQHAELVEPIERAAYRRRRDV